MDKRLNVVFATDENYLQHCTVALTSLIHNNKKILGRIFIINEFKCTKQLDEIITFYAANYGVYIESIKIDGAVFDTFKVLTHVSKAAYFRLILDSVIPVDISEVLYLDCDVVINGDISDLLKLDFTFNHIPFQLYAVDHEFEETNIQDIKSGGNDNTFIDYRDYFNSGVLFLNLNEMRKLNSSESLIFIAQKFRHILSLEDQDVLNIHFYKKWGRLDYTYNAWRWVNSGYSLQNTPKIIHFSAKNKPWHIDNTHPFRSLYWDYLKYTPFASFKPLESYMDAYKKIIFSRCRNQIMKKRQAG